ncbi:MAG: excalibur calcium-binding domain-containing protein [Micrococcaceae bacterium]
MEKQNDNNEPEINNENISQNNKNVNHGKEEVKKVISEESHETVNTQLESNQDTDNNTKAADETVNETKTTAENIETQTENAVKKEKTSTVTKTANTEHKAKAKSGGKSKKDKGGLMYVLVGAIALALILTLFNLIRHNHSVEYKITATGSATVTYDKGNANQKVKKIHKSYHETVRLTENKLNAYQARVTVESAAKDKATTQASCEIYIDKKLVAQKFLYGANSHTTCTAHAYSKEIKAANPNLYKPKTRLPRHATQSVNFKSCQAARAAGATPLFKGQPGYSTTLDHDGNGIACEPTNS